MRLLLLLSAPALLGLLASCGKDPQSGRAATKQTVPVTTATVTQRAIPIQIRAIGNVQPYSTVSIKAQISGELFEVHFEEGQYVKKGQLLFTIDPRPFQAALKQAEATLQQAKASLKQAIANLAKDTADAKNADAESARYAQLYHSG
ncbi:MAG TPA: biotin/lipoyl-binding protein, partial [Bryobacterales bacterium]|nr:biotin/lipoyl-binding protein [Bryobacterales bacterium]